jgi:hypothetical protein
MVKWGIEAVQPVVVNTYKGRDTGRDLFGVSPGADTVFEWLAFAVALPLSLLYSLWHWIGRALGVPVIHSFTRNGIPVGAQLLSILLLPIVLGIACTELAVHRLGLEADLTTNLVRRRYCLPWDTR